MYVRVENVPKSGIFPDAQQKRLQFGSEVPAGTEKPRMRSTAGHELGYFSSCITEFVAVPEIALGLRPVFQGFSLSILGISSDFSQKLT